MNSTDYSANILVPLQNYQIGILDETLNSLQKTGEGAVSLFTGGGKSFIGARIALDYLEREKGEVLWFGTLAANRNVYESVIVKLPPKFKKKIHMKSYESIWHDDISLPIGPYKTALIILDESHRALAKKSIKFILETLRSYNKPRVAMSATQRRTDGLRSFEYLTPNAIWEDYNCSWASDNNIINELNYMVCATRLSNFDISELNRYKYLGRLYPDIRAKCEELEHIMGRYTFDLGRDVLLTIKESPMDLDASKGVRHIVFYNKVRNMLNSRDMIVNIYGNLYPNANIRVYTYYSKQSVADSMRVLKEAVNSEPLPNTVDVIMTVDKGSESIHPRGIKSVMFFRETGSYIKFIQQVGRAITLRTISNTPTYIFDFSDGCVSLLRGATINLGRRGTQDRLTNYGVESLDDIEERIKSVISRNVRVSIDFATDKLNEISNRLNDLRDESQNGAKSKLLKQVYDDAIKYDKNKRLKSAPTIGCLSDIAREMKANGFRNYNSPDIAKDGGFTDEFIEWFSDISDMLIKESLDKKSSTYDILIGTGWLPYSGVYSPENLPNLSVSQFEAIDRIAKTLSKLDYDYSKLKNTMVATKLLFTLIKQNTHNEVPVGVCTYARHNGVDLSVDRLSFNDIKNISDESDLDTYNDYLKQKKVADKLREMLKDYKIDRETDEGRQEFDLRKRTWSLLMAYELDNGTKHSNAYGKFIRHKLLNQYKREFAFLVLKPLDQSHCLLLIRILKTIEDLEIVRTPHQEFLFEHANMAELSYIEKYILAIHGIKTKAAFNELLDHTDWKVRFNKAIDGDQDEIIFFERLDKQYLDDYRLKMLRTNQFRRAKRDIADSLDTEILKKSLKYLYSPNDYIKKQTIKAIKSKELTALDVATIPFPDYAQDSCTRLLTGLSKNSDPNLYAKDISIIRGTLSSSISCVDMVLIQVIDILNEIDTDIAGKLQSILKMSKMHTV